MEKESSSMSAFVKVEKELKSAIEVLTNHESERSKQLAKYEKRVAELTETLEQKTENALKNRTQLEALKEDCVQQSMQASEKIELLEFEIEEMKVNETRKINALKREIQKRGLDTSVIMKQPSGKALKKSRALCWKKKSKK